MPSSIPPCFARNEHQSKGAFLQTHRRPSVRLGGDAIKVNLFLDGGEIFPLPTSGGGKCFDRKNIKAGRSSQRNPRHVTGGWADFLGRVTSWLPLRSSSLLTARTWCLLTAGRHSPHGSLCKDQAGVLVWQTRGTRSSQSGRRYTQIKQRIQC